MMASKEEEVKKKIAWLQHQLDLNDAALEKMGRNLDESEKNLEFLVRENDRLRIALEEQMIIDRKLYDEILIDYSMKDGAIEIYESQLEEIGNRCQIAESATIEAQRKCENLEMVNKFLSVKSTMLEKQLQKNGIGDLLSNAGTSSAPAPPLSNEIQNSPSSATSSTLSDDFFRRTTSHVAVTQGIVSQFCGVYDLKLNKVGNGSINGNGNIDQAPIIDNRRDAAVQTTPKKDFEQHSSLVFCADCKDMQLELDNVTRQKNDAARKLDYKDRKIEELKSTLRKTKREFDKKKEEAKSYKRDRKRKDEKSRDLSKEVKALRKQNLDFESEIKNLKKELKEATSQHTKSDGNCEESVSSSSSEQGGNFDGVGVEIRHSAKLVPLKRSVSPDVDNDDERNKKSMGIKFHLKAKRLNSNIENPINDIFSP